MPDNPRPQDLVSAHTLVDNLKRRLADERWSARKAAIKLNVSPMYISRRLNGEVECTVSDLFIFAELLRIPVVELFELPRLGSNQEPSG